MKRQKSAGYSTVPVCSNRTTKGLDLLVDPELFPQNSIGNSFQGVFTECLDTLDLPVILVQSFCFFHFTSVLSEHWGHGVGVYEFWLLEKNFHHNLALKRLASGVTQTIAVRPVHFV